MLNPPPLDASLVFWMIISTVICCKLWRQWREHARYQRKKTHPHD